MADEERTWMKTAGCSDIHELNPWCSTYGCVKATKKDRHLEDSLPEPVEELELGWHTWARTYATNQPTKGEPNDHCGASDCPGDRLLRVHSEPG